ncbi:immunoreactive 47 kDa antigen PG97 [Bacteroidetes oral taxon 274 str. F0058]|nr:immunoreactive 47 kDa antigen PG97 [Bacteroidetes oral taxon 274 str. F0058]
MKAAKDKNWEVLDFFQHKPYDGVDDTKYTTKQPSVVLTTMRTEGTWKLKLKADEQAKPYIWIDKNNNKLYDYGEEVTEYNGFVEFAQSTNTIAVYGKISQLYCQGNSLTNLDITKNTALTLLDCSNNKLTDLNIVDSTRLETLLCYKNKITSLDLSKDTNLIFVSCNENMLTSIDISKNNKLTALYVSNNSLSALDISKNTELRALTCEKNMLTSLNLFNNTKLETLYCAKNKLSTLDISKNTALNLVSCEENDINKLNLSENKELTSLYCYANEIKGQDMTNLVNSLSDRTNKKAGELYIIDTKNNEEKNVCLVADVAIAKKHNWAVFDYKGKENYGKNPYEGSTTSSSHIATEDSIRVFPIPARSVLNIRLPYSLSDKSLTVTDASGRVVMKTNTTSAEKEMTLDVSSLYNGVYFLMIEDKIIRFVVCR